MRYSFFCLLLLFSSSIFAQQREIPDDLTAANIKQLMYADKKVHQGELRMVLLRQIGEACVTSEFPQEQLDSTLASYF